VNAKGAITIPAALRREMGLKVGTLVAFRREGDTIVAQPITPEFIDSLCGCTKGVGREREAMHREDKQR